MRLINGFLHHQLRLLFVGALLGLLLQGCTTPLVDVKVTAGPGCPTDDDGVGLCTTPVSYSSSAAGFYQDPNGPNLPAGTTITCKSGSKKCKAYPGNCSGMNCINRIKNIANNQGDCYCGCPF